MATKDSASTKGLRADWTLEPQMETGIALSATVKEVVFGLQWTPAEEGESKRLRDEPANLDACCVLFDGRGRVLETIHPDHPRNANGSVVHTGDSLTGASTWDDERIFVFLEAIPAQAARLAFAVTSANGRPFDEVRGASCHVSDARAERELMRVELTSLGDLTLHCVALLQRGEAGWRLAAGTPDFARANLRDPTALLRR